MKKRYLLGASVVAAMPTIGFLAQSSPASAQTATNWSGPSIGIVGGGGFGNSSQTDQGYSCAQLGNCPTVPTLPTLPADGSYNVNGGAIGGSIGYDWQNGPWVYGLAADYSWADVIGSSGTCGAISGFPHACGTRLESFGTVRGRVGYVMGSGYWLPYITGGLAVGNVKAWDSLTGASGSDFRAGWTVGGGVEFALAPRWTLGLEYLYADLGNRQTFDVVPGIPENVSFSASFIRANIGYKF
jgi:opacity protein-like surface antigen